MSESLLALLGRKRPLFEADLATHGEALAAAVRGSRFLVVGGAGSIGQAVVREIFKRSPRCLHVVDLSENNLVELVRDIRSSMGYIEGEFKTFAVDFSAVEFRALLADSVERIGGYDYVLNLSALKHVRSEKDPFTLMRLLQVNALATDDLRAWCAQHAVRKFFCVSTDKATNPVNMMGCSKRIMELMLFAGSDEVAVSTARFANVAFSDGSLLHGFNQRIQRRQPISAPNDVKRYFITQAESGVLCMASCLLGNNREIFFPKLDQELNLIPFSDIATRYLASRGFEAVPCESEEVARQRAEELIPMRRWPVFYFASDTSGEKPFEEFYDDRSDIDMARFRDLGVIRNPEKGGEAELRNFRSEIDLLRSRERWSKIELVEMFQTLVPEFTHLETGKYLDDRM